MQPQLAEPTRAAVAGVRLVAGARRLAAVLERRYRLVLGVFVAVQWAGGLAIALSAAHDGWVYYSGGDGTYYWTGAWALAHLDVPRSYVGYGTSALWTPAAAGFGPSLVEGLPFVVLLNVLVLLPLALLFLYGVAERLAGRLFGLFAAATWLVAPLLAYRMTRPDIQPRVIDVFLPGAIGLNMLADFPSLVVVLGAAYFALRALDARSWTDALAAGTLAGFAIGIKPANALFLPALAIGFLVRRHWRALAAVGAGLVLPLVALTVWKQRGLGQLPILTLGETRVAAGSGPLSSLTDPLSRYGGLDWGTIELNLQAIREIFWSKTLLEWFAIAGTFALLRRSFVNGLVVVTWFAAYFLVKGSSQFANVYAMSFFRLLEPAYPAFLLLAAASTALLWPRAGRIPAAPPAPRPLGLRPALAVAVVLGALPLLLVGVASPASAGSTAEIANAGVMVPVRISGFAARADSSGAVHLSWPSQAGSGYRVLRSRTAEQDCAASSVGVRTCSVAADTLANVPETGFIDRPPPGTWVYRVAAVAAWNGDLGNGDPILLSKPLTVEVRR